MGKNKRLSLLPSSFKWAISAFVLLTCLGFGGAALMSHDRYEWSHEKTIQYYLGDPAEGEAAFKKPYSHLIGITHVHSYTMPLVFFVIWILLQGVPTSSGFKKWMVLGGSASILLYNLAPYLVRYVSLKSVSVFTVGGIGLFLFYFLPAFFILFEIWFGKKEEE